jgi:hypothetical protein
LSKLNPLAGARNHRNVLRRPGSGETVTGAVGNLPPSQEDLPMTTTTAQSIAPRPLRDSLARLALAGFAGGMVDFVYASIMGLTHGRTVMRVWQGVASGWLGPAARDGGVATMLLGIVTHFGIATCMAGAYALAAGRFDVLYRRWLICAPLYGLVLYGVMYRIVLPLRFPGAGKWQGADSVLDIASHVGLAMVAAWVLSRPPRPR